ncbi:MAG: valine--tRNA ligase, partial [Thermoprotei archaeon]
MEHNEIPKVYDPSQAEPLWENYWLKEEVYREVYALKGNGRSLYVVDTPPPFTSGNLHVGQGYWISIADTLARYKRMRGFDVVLPQGWDTHGLPTELKVEKQLGVSRVNRDEFEKKCVEWTQQMIHLMKADMIRLGYRPQWEEFEYSTHSPEYLRAVQLSLIRMYSQGLIYVDRFPVLWCPNCSTAIAQAETGYEERDGVLYTVRFEVEGGSYLSIATTRPELIPACQAIMINPQDQRYTHLLGRRVKLPFTERYVRVLTDSEVDMGFGTGAVMVCSYGDETDIKWIRRYALPTSQIIDEKGYFVAPEWLKGKSISEARKEIVSRLRSAGAIQEEKRIRHSVLIHAERSDCRAPIEFLEKEQVLIKTKAFLDRVSEAASQIVFHPHYMREKLNDWIASIEWDWIASRQRVFGTPFPFYHCSSCGSLIPVPEDRLPFDPRKSEKLFKTCPKCASDKVSPILDVCDGWIDSSITPLFVTGQYSDRKPPGEAYPVDLRIQGQDIIRTWLFYTIFRCTMLTSKPPFKEALVHGWILDAQGKKMSKSRESLPLKRIVEEYGADSLRYSLMTFSVGADFEFTPDFVRRGKLFMQKIWSAYRFSAPHITNVLKRVSKSPIDNWILQRLKETVRRMTEHFDSYEFNDGLEVFHNFFWHELCDEYLEAVKHRASSDEDAKNTLSNVMWTSLRLLAPIMPHLAEELYQRFFTHIGKISIHATEWPSTEEFQVDENLAELGAKVIYVIKQARRIKALNNIPLGQRVTKVVIGIPKEYQDVT